MNFTPLPGTAAEAKALKATLGLDDEQVLIGARPAALEQTRRAHAFAPATRAFFWPSARPSRRDVGQLQGEVRLQAPQKGENVAVALGLALAEANHLRSGNDDGILSGAGSRKDLVGSDLVVLSACDTPSERSNGEGVLGCAGRSCSQNQHTGGESVEGLTMRQARS